jgi:hypothetical protein
MEQSYLHWTPYILPFVVMAGYVIHLSRYTSSGRSSAWVHVLVFLVVVAFFYLYRVDDRIRGTDVRTREARSSFVEALEKEPIARVESDRIDFYPMKYVGKDAPLKLRYIPLYKDVVEMLRDIRFVRRFDDGAYRQFILVLERYLELYYRSITYDDVEECIHNFSTMKDLRRELINIAHTFIISTPRYFKRPVLRQKMPTDAYLYRKLRYIHSFTYEKLRVISKKCNHRNQYSMRAKPPWGHNEYTDNRFNVF